jgi:predicted GIY-YIG superfamily endonuclease
MYYVYILKDKNSKIYIGYSSNLKRCIYEHLHNQVYTTSRMDEPKLFYYEAYSDKLNAELRERKLKEFGSSYHGLIKRITTF